MTIFVPGGTTHLPRGRIKAERLTGVDFTCGLPQHDRTRFLAQQSAAQSFVTLYKSLGGGWEDYQEFPPIPRPMPAIAAAFKRLIDRTPTP